METPKNYNNTIPNLLHYTKEQQENFTKRFLESSKRAGEFVAQYGKSNPASSDLVKFKQALSTFLFNDFLKHFSREECALIAADNTCEQLIITLRNTLMEKMRGRN